MQQVKTMLVEQNVISLRTAFILGTQGLVCFVLLPEWVDSSVPKPIDHTKWESTWLYRPKQSFLKELRLKMNEFDIAHSIRALRFEAPPDFKLLWNESGRSVAVFLNEEPWAFIHEEKKNGYSKGILGRELPNPWNQELFEKTFGSET